MATRYVTRERIVNARMFLRQFDALDRRHCSAVEFLQLKFSCTPRQALDLYTAVRPETTPAAIEARQAAHRQADPHCTCNDCMADHIATQPDAGIVAADRAFRRSQNVED